MVLNVLSIIAYRSTYGSYPPEQGWYIIEVETEGVGYFVVTVNSEYFVTKSDDTPSPSKFNIPIQLMQAGDYTICAEAI